MATLKKKKLPKQPKANSSQLAWDRYEKKLALVVAHNNKVEAERQRRSGMRERYLQRTKVTI